MGPDALVLLLLMLAVSSGCAAPSSDSGTASTVWIGPTCPVERDPPDLECADRPYETGLAVTTPDGSRVIEEFESDEDRQFRVLVEPGEYAIRSSPEAGSRPYCASCGTIVVVECEYAEADVSCDPGSR